MAKFLKSIDFSDRAVYERMRDYLENDVFVFKYYEDALNFVRNMERYFRIQPDFKDKNADLYSSYVALMDKAKFICLPALSNNEILALFQNRLTRMFELPDYQLWPLLVGKLMTFIDFNERDIFKRQLREVMLDNKERLTSRPIENGQSKEPTVSNWLRDYLGEVDMKPVNKVVLVEYFSKRRSYQQLPADERDKVKVIIEVFEKLKLSSALPEGIEESITVMTEDGMKSIEQGVFKKVPDQNIDNWKIFNQIANIGRESNPPVPAGAGVPDNNNEPITPSQLAVNNTKPTDAGPSKIDEAHKKHLGVENLLKIYSQNPDEQQAIYEEEKKILKRVGQEQMNVRPEFEEAVRSNNRNRVIAFLHVLAKTQDLPMVMKTDGVFRDYLKEKYGPEALTQFDAQPGDPVFYSLWLQHLLKQRLQMLESDSARIGTKLANLLGRKYLKVAYIDSVTGSFKWVPVKKEKNRLLLVR